MGRILFFVIIALLIALGIYTTRSKKIRDELRAEQKRDRRKDKASSEPMVRCAHCGLHVPRSEALPREGHYYCCAEHREQGPR